MSVIKRVPFSHFLTERKIKIKPAEANAKGLSRVDKIDFSANIHLSNRTTNTDMIVVKPGDLLISGINAEKGAVAVYQGEKDVLASIHYSSYEYDQKKIDIGFLKWFLKSSKFKNLLSQSSNSGIKTELKAKHLLPLEIDLPDLATQKSIVRLIENRSNIANETVSEFTSQLTDLQRLRQSILQEAVQGKLVPQDKRDEPASELLKKIKTEKEALQKAGKLKKEKPLPPVTAEEMPFALPEGWVWCRLGEISNKITDGFHNTPHRVSKGIPYIFATHIKTNKIFWDECSYVSPEDHKELWQKSYPQKGEILIVNIGAGCGTPAIIDVDFEFSFKNSAIIKQNALVSNQYLFFFIISIQRKIQSSITQGGAQPYLSLKMINNLAIPLPPLPEQQRIVARVKELMSLCDALEAELKKAQEDAERLLQAVLREAFEGKGIN